MTPRPALSSTGAEVHLGAGGLAPGRKRGVEDTGFEAIDEFRAGCMVIQRRLEDAAQGADHRHSYGSPDDAERDQYEAEQGADSGADADQDDSRNESKEADQPEPDLADEVLAPGSLEQLD